jgi:hypothetical protein
VSEPTPTTEERLRFKSALLDLSKPDYEVVRADFIIRFGYTTFRDLQTELFREIVAENPPEKGGAS